MDSFETFVRERGDALYRYGYVLTGSPHDAADLVQEALVRLRAGWSRVKNRDDPEGYVRAKNARPTRSGNALRPSTFRVGSSPDRPAAATHGEMAMDADAARGTINQILFDIDRIRDLADDAMAAMCADAIVNHRTFLGPPRQYADAMDAVLREGRLSEQTLSMSRRHTEAELLEFLRRVRLELANLDPGLA